MRSRIISPEMNLIEEIASGLDADGRDYSGSTVIFPGKRPAHFLMKALASRTGASFVPPRIFSMDEFVDTLAAGIVPMRKLETIDAVALLYDIHLAASHPLGGSGFMTADSFFPLGLKIYRDVEELTIEGVSPQSVMGIESLIGGGVPEQSKIRLQSLCFFYQEFYREVEARGFSTRSGRYWAAVEGIDGAGPGRSGRMIFAGFFALTAAEKALFGKLSKRGDTECFFQDGKGLREMIGELGAEAVSPVAKADSPAMHFYSGPDAHGQVLALGNVLGANKADERIDEKTVIVLPSSDTLFPMVRQGLSGLPDDGYNISMGYPLHRTPVFGFLNGLMDLVSSMDGDRVYIPDYLKFILHPYTKNIYYLGKSDPTRILLHAVEEGLLKHKAKAFITLEEIEGDPRVFEEAAKRLSSEGGEVSAEVLKTHIRDIHRNTVERFLAFENIGAFARQCSDVLVFIFSHSTARLHPLFYPFSESFLAALDLLSRSLMRGISFEERSGYFTFFRKYITTGHVPFSGTPVKGLQVLGFLETRNLKFDRVFVLDANEGVIPDTGREETLLPFKVREMLGLPTYIDRDRIASYYFDVLLKGAKEAHLFFIENDRAERSRFVEKLLWEQQKKRRNMDSKAYIRPIQYKVNLVNKAPGAVAKNPGVVSFLKDISYSATALNQYLRCPLAFYYGNVLGISRKKGISGEIERDDLGNLVHEILMKYFSARKGRLLRKTDIDPGEMRRLVERSFEKEYDRDPSGSLYLLQRQIRRHLTDFLGEYFIPLVGERNVTILGLEESIRITVDSYKLKGRLDSVEQRDDKTVIVDFKTGANTAYLKVDAARLDPGKRETWGRAIGSLQLPFYVLLYSGKYGKAVDDLDAVFLLLGRSKMSRAIELPLFGGESAVEIYRPLKAVIFEILREINDPAVPFGPPADKRKTCPGCDYQYLCGTQWIAR